MLCFLPSNLFFYQDVKYVANNSLVQFQIWDFPGDFQFTDQIALGDQILTEEQIFRNCQALVFVLDAQDDPYTDALQKLHETIVRANKYNPNIVFEVFIHKVDGDLFLSDEQKVDCQRDIHEQIYAELRERDLDHIQVEFQLTSIYDHSVFEAFSKVVQKLIPHLDHMERLMDILISTCNIEKAFLFDVVSKIYIATDSNPVDMQSYELCSDMIDVVIDISCIYGLDSTTEGLAYDGKSSSMCKWIKKLVLLACCCCRVTVYWPFFVSCIFISCLFVPPCVPSSFEQRNGVVFKRSVGLFSIGVFASWK